MTLIVVVISLFYPNHHLEQWCSRTLGEMYALSGIA